jgi:hypothetical protein
MHLRDAQNMLSQCEIYFRRYPFHGTPVSREDHARNMCEFYFGCFYIIKNRLKETLNRLRAVCPHSKVHIGKTLRAFEKGFEQEIRIRNSIQHHQPYGDVAIERISLARLLASGESARSKGWERQHLTAYRKFCSAWSRRARDNAEIVEALIDSVAVNGDHRLLFGQSGGHLGIDVAKLRISVGVTVALRGLTVAGAGAASPGSRGQPHPGRPLAQ